MLIIPIQNKPDWSNPPLITVGLILINLLVFLFYQGNDGEISARAASIYHENNLLQMERGYYVDYLRAENPDEAAALKQLNEGQDDYLFWSIFYDRGFDHHLAELWQEGVIPVNEETRRWRGKRGEFEQQRNRISSIAAGLTPAEAKPFTFLTSLFLHGGWGHLIGNMVFLFLFGFTLETVLRARVYLSLYLVSGIAADLLFMGLNPDSYGPLIGASGAISGLMGMYLSLYRLRQIRFFYTVFFYFGEFRAPALLILPLWLAKELYGQYFVESNTAYWAHVGGLLSGAGLMLLAQRSLKQFSEGEDVKAQEDEVAQALKKVQLAMTQLDYGKARTLARALCQRFPADPRPWHMLFDLHKNQSEQKTFHDTTFALLKQFCSEESPFPGWRPHIQTIMEEYRGIAPRMPAMTGNMCLTLARTFWRGGARLECEKLLELARQKKANPQAMLSFLNHMADFYRKRQQTAKVKQTDHLISQLRAASPPTSGSG